MWEGPVLEWIFLAVLPDLVLNSGLPIGSTWMKDSAAIINGFLLELLKTMASAGQVLTPSRHLQLRASPCGGSTQEGLFGAGSASQALGLSGSDFLT